MCKNRTVRLKAYIKIFYAKAIPSLLFFEKTLPV